MTQGRNGFTGTAHGERRGEGGFALLITVLMLALIGIIGLASMDTVTRDRQVAGYHSRAQPTLYAADAGVAFGMGLIREDAPQLAAEGGEAALMDYNPSAGAPPDFPNLANAQSLGDDFPAPGSPRFYMDPNARNPNDLPAPPQAVRYIGKGERCTFGIMDWRENQTPNWHWALWDLRVRADSPGGADVNVQATGANCHPYD